jgi:hypothetical protein
MERASSPAAAQATEPAVPPLHAELSDLAFLLGIWRGEGDGVWPGIEPFTYGEEMRFEHVGDAFLVYAQRSWSLDDGSPIHLERGFLRPAGHGRVERVLEVASTSVGLTSTADPVTELHRRIEVRGEVLSYRLDMAMREVPLTWHVRGRLTRD